MNRRLGYALATAAALAATLLIALGASNGTSIGPLVENSNPATIPLNDNTRLVIDNVDGDRVVGHVEVRVRGDWRGVSLRDPNARGVIPAR